MFCLVFCVLFSSVGMVAHAEGSVDWEYGDDGSYAFVIDGDPDPQLVGDFGSLMLLTMRWYTFRQPFVSTICG